MPLIGNAIFKIYNGKGIRPKIGRSGGTYWLDLGDDDGNVYMTIFFKEMDELRNFVDELMTSLIDLEDPGLMVLAGRGKTKCLRRLS